MGLQMAGMADISWKQPDMSGNGWNGLKLLEFAGIGWNGWKWL